jgi:hypothetical protein
VLAVFDEPITPEPGNTPANLFSCGLNFAKCTIYVKDDAAMTTYESAASSNNVQCAIKIA